MNNSKELIQFALSNIEKQRGIMKCPICGNDYKNKVFSLNSAIILYMKEGDVVKEGLPPCTVDNTIKHNSGFSYYMQKL